MHLLVSIVLQYLKLLLTKFPLFLTILSHAKPLLVLSCLFALLCMYYLLLPTFCSSPLCLELILIFPPSSPFLGSSATPLHLTKMRGKHDLFHPSSRALFALYLISDSRVLTKERKRPCGEFLCKLFARDDVFLIFISVKRPLLLLLLLLQGRTPIFAHIPRQEHDSFHFEHTTC